MCRACDSQERRTPEAAATPANLWEVPRSLRCPVVGACLTLDDIRKTFKRAGIPVKGIRPYELHGTSVEFLDGENRISIRFDRILKKRYRDALSQLEGLDEEGLARAWETGLRSGNMEGVLLGIALRRDLSEGFVATVFGEIHMLGHTASSREMLARREVASGREQSERLRLLLREEKRRRRELEKENLELRSRSDGPRNGGGETIGDGAGMEKLKTEIANREETLSKLSAENGRLMAQVALLAREKDRLLNEVGDERRENGMLLQEIAALASHIGSPGEAGRECEACAGGCLCEGEACPRFDLCAKRVLIVGGITKLRHLYRDLVEAGGGVFDYHDGYMTSSKHNLEARVKRSDLVICPVTCNSHGACLKVKQLCRKYNKAVNMLSSASISAISGALTAARTECVN